MGSKKLFYLKPEKKHLAYIVIYIFNVEFRISLLAPLV